MADPLEGFLSIGQVLRPQGLTGQVKIRPDTDDPGRFLALKHVYVPDRDGLAEKVDISQVSVRAGFVYLNLGGDSSVDMAEKRRGLMLFVPREEAVELGENENFIVDIIGCTLLDTRGKALGSVLDVLQPGANDVYVVGTEKGRLLVPALRHVILEVNTAHKTITADAERLWEVSLYED